MINRKLLSILGEHLFKKKVLLLYGARQVGKTTLFDDLKASLTYPVLTVSGDEADVREQFAKTSSTKLRLIIGGAKLLIIDEAQYIDEIGQTLKLIHDHIPEVQVIATGSSSLDLAIKTNEQLTEQKFEFMMFPLSFGEMCGHHGFLAETRLLEHRMIFGYYPEIVVEQGNEQKLLKLLVNSYLYKDVLQLEQVKRPALIHKLLKALALQIGSEVSYNELAQTVGADIQTVERYIDILEQAFVLFRLSSFSRNVRNELKKSRKIYFFDNGVRNAIVGNFNNCSSRTDTGALWENFILSERMKHNVYAGRDVKMYFWRTTQQQEIDYIEEENGTLHCFEFKWKPGKSSKLSKTFADAYHPDSYATITPQNMETFLL